MWGVYCPKHIYPLVTRTGFWYAVPRDRDIWNRIQKLCTLQCHDPLTSVYNSCTRNYVPYTARTLWHLCTTAVPEIMYCTVPWPSDIYVQKLYQKLDTVQCQDPLTSVYNSCTRNYVLYSAPTLWHLCTKAVPEIRYCTMPGPSDICVQQLYQKLHTVQCQDPLTSVYNSCTSNYILYSARTLWNLRKTAVPATTYRTMPGPSDICVQQLYQKLCTVQCHDPLTSVYNCRTRNYVLCSAMTRWHLCTTAVPSTDGPYHACFPSGNSLLAKVFMSLKLIFSYASWIIMIVR